MVKYVKYVTGTDSSIYFVVLGNKRIGATIFTSFKLHLEILKIPIFVNIFIFRHNVGLGQLARNA